MISLYDEHPYWGLRTIVEQDEEIERLSFSYYTYVPQSLQDVRVGFFVSRSEFLQKDYVDKVICGTPLGQELALHSTIFHKSRGLVHIPMVDMSTGSSAQLEKVKPILGDEIFNNFEWYRSGRSYHGYGRCLMSHKEWIIQMGKLLLVNKLGVPPTVDPRWVGHRLIAGYSALRWTKNTAHYIDNPKKINI